MTSRQRLLTVAAVLAAAFSTVVAFARPSSVVVMTNSGISASSFCTSTGKVTVVQAVTQDANSQVSFGATYLTGISGTSNTYSFGNGNHDVAKGCYSHSIVSTTVMGNGTAKSTVWYD
jgi:hypothetical protein